MKAEAFRYGRRLLFGSNARHYTGRARKVIVSPRASLQVREYAEVAKSVQDTDVKEIEQTNAHDNSPKDGTQLDIQRIPLQSSTYSVQLGPYGTWFFPVFLRDACKCSKCVDPSSKQKNFRTTDIPTNIRILEVKELREGNVQIRWENDIPGFGQDHMSDYSRNFFYTHQIRKTFVAGRFDCAQQNRYLRWDQELLTNRLQFINYEEYMKSGPSLLLALKQLSLLGILLIRDVPSSETAVEAIAGRIGTVRDTFYGRTWDVKSVPQAKNVAYTAQYLGFHMDLLYMTNPPGFQLLHCLKNSCEGGSSMFSDAFNAVANLPRRDFNNLQRFYIPYHYCNAGEHYYSAPPVIERRRRHPKSRYLGYDTFINYSPPFQADHIDMGSKSGFSDPADESILQEIKSLRAFAAQIEDPSNVYEYKMQEGECVIFNNRRVLHARKEFDTSSGERWLKGAYLDTDVFMSRYRVMRDKLRHLDYSDDALYRGSKYVHPQPASEESGSKS